MRRPFVGGLAAVLALSICSLATADKKGKHKGKSKAHADQVHVTFGLDERRSAQTFFVESYGRGNCPPGLAKKNNGCLPPGHAKKRYIVGRPLPREVVIVELPVVLATRVGPPPTGYRYGLVDGDLVKLAIGSALVVDAIHGIVR